MNESKTSGKEKVSGTFAILGHAFYFVITMPIFLIVLSAFCYALVHDFKLDIFFIVAFFAGT
ncbi:MAG TPA: hypothetical protein VK927_02775, partial [Adhaeribacter sp.]|nr:hypothetical protein [Adhaeribacter sp.]